MNWARLSSVTVAVACALVILANAPAIVVEPLQTAVAQVRWNAYNRETAEQSAVNPNSGPVVTSATKAK